ncbi:MAG: O-antigen ligase family protein [Candidatus Moraniibacteriota bacterium]
MSGMLIGVALGLIFFGNSHGFGILKSWFLLPLLFLWVVAPRIQTTSQQKALLGGWLLALSLIASEALLAFILGYETTFDHRLHGVFLSPNALALFIFPTPLLLLFFFQTTRDFSFRLLLSLLTILNLVVLYLTFSYTVWISLIISLFVWILFQYPSTRKKISISFLLLISILIASQTQQEKITNWFTSPERSSLASRDIIWRASLQMIQDHPIIGIGAGNFQSTYLEYQQFFPPYLEWAVPEPHHIFLAFWLESGLIGLISFLIFLSFVFYTLFLHIRKNPTLIIGFFLLAYFVGISVQGLFDTPFWSLPLAYSFWYAVLLFLITLSDTEFACSDR